ncbi:MAG: PaaI family thioesterase [Oscillospiraceae bacterium]|nr:PaaI family thioesterase [Oscillospiraceae bacterium]
MSDNYSESSLWMRGNVESLFNAVRRVDASKKRITSVMEPEFYDCSFEEKWLTLSFEVLDCELNPNKTMMGGLIATALDITYGVLVISLTGQDSPPTINLNVNFVRPIAAGDTLLCTAKVTSWGKKVIHLSCEGICKSNGKTAVSSTAVFLSPDQWQSES